MDLSDKQQVIQVAEPDSTAKLGDRWGADILEDRQRELEEWQHEWNAESDYDATGPIQSADIKITGADVFYLAARSIVDTKYFDARDNRLVLIPDLATAYKALRAAAKDEDKDLLIDLSALHLEGAELEGAYLEGAYLHAAHLEGTELGKAHLEGADLSDAHLEGADLSDAHLEGADLSDAHLEGADLSDAYLERADLHWSRLEGANLGGAYLEGALLYEANLEGAYLRAAA